ncbi:MAG: helix-turn-helix transcriptional regulator [Clostridia bacterium]|nr:helix-turn-helix transcriptional regulator [Clostridia bacterium]
MTTTIGQRIKNFRKNAGLSQANLAGRIGVTAQTVSKWECDVGLPDIVQIVPLAEVLDVSCDAILGADANMEANVKAAYDAVEEKWKDGVDNQSPDRTDMHRTFDYFTASRELFRRYPMNFKVARQGAIEGGWLLGHTYRGLPEINGFDAKSVLRDVERMCRAIINYDDDISEKMEAKSRLAIAYFSMGEDEKAKEEVEGLPEKNKTLVLHSSAISRSEEEKRIEAAKHGFTEACDDFLYWVRAIADGYSAAAMRKEALKACEDLISFCDRFVDFCDIRLLLSKKRLAYLLTAQNHIRSGDYDKALDAIEKMTDVVIEYKKAVKTLPTTAQGSIYFDPDPDNDDYYSRPGAMSWFDNSLMWAVSDFADKTGNPVVTSERYKACERRLKEAE